MRRRDPQGHDLTAASKISQHMELSANAPADETSNDKNAQCERNRKRNERRRRLRESHPIRNLTEALNQVKSRVHTTPEQCLMSITTIARQA
jgi:hypothetical protein